MTEVDPTHFSFGAVTPVLAYFVSVLGSLLGLMCTERCRAREGGARFGWLLAGAVSIGYTGIWSMHFIAMLGFSVPGTHLTYDPGLTVVSAVVAIGVVSVGLFVAVSLPGLPGLLLGGAAAGLGVAGMHYMGMASMQMHGELWHDVATVVASVMIAVAAATAALWAALTIDSRWGKIGAALIMGFAVSTMHYTGMAGVHVATEAASGSVPAEDGMAAIDFLFPLIVVSGTFTCLLALLLLLSPSEREMKEESRARARLERPSPPPNPAFTPRAASLPQQRSRPSTTAPRR